tara:strand:- start:3599 stop:4552 length:954 start_codon:yes stop_codon:yes gene_type:complete
MSDIFQSGFSNIGARAIQQAKEKADTYQQELTKKEMISQTEESLGGIKLFTSGRELGSKILSSKLKPYLKQQAKKLLKKAKPDEPDEPDTEPPTTEPPNTAPTAGAEEPIQLEPIGEVAEETQPVVQDLSLGKSLYTTKGLERFGRIAKARKARNIEKGMSEEDADDDMNAFIQQRQSIYNSQKARANNNVEEQETDAQESAKAEENAANEAKAATKAKPTGSSKPDENEPKPEDDDDVEDLGEAGGKGLAGEGAVEGTEITGMEAFASVLDAIPGLDIIGAALGASGLIAGFTKKPPHAIATVAPAYSGASNQVGY